MKKETLLNEIACAVISLERENKSGAYIKDAEKIISDWIDKYEAEKELIIAKALRKKGTDKWYDILDLGIMHGFPCLLIEDATEEFLVEIGSFPKDAELVDIEIKISKP